MSTCVDNRRVITFCIGVFLAIVWQISAAAGWATGRVTALDPAKGKIEIDGVNLELPLSGKRDLVNEIKTGQAVQYESDGKKLIQIRPVKGEVDFPALMAPLPGASMKTSPKRQ